MKATQKTSRPASITVNNRAKRKGNGVVAANDSSNGKITGSKNISTHIERVFRALDRNNTGLLILSDVAAAFENNGIKIDDPRIRQSIESLTAITGPINIDQFADAFRTNFSMIENAIKDRFIVPRFSKFAEEIDHIYDECVKIRDGKVADYIPQLARVEADQFAVAVTSIDGQQAAFGDSDTPYCVQSSCKPVNYAMALEQNGEDFVHRHVGREPSGRSFNELALNPRGLPHNPMINAGSIMSCSMIHSDLPLADRFDHVTKTWAKLAGGSAPSFNNPIYLSEKATADRNFALGYFMHEQKAFPDNTDLLETLDFYFQTCSVEVTAKQMSMVAATFANSGVCPVTNERVLSNDTVKNCLSLMNSCGMYDFSGEFAFTIGLPAKSGVSGALMVVIPQVMGFAIWSPRLDELGNTVRGVEFCRRLVERFSFHNYDNILSHATKKDPTKRDAQHRGDQVYQMINAASIGDIQEITRLLAHGVDINASDYDGRTPLHLAAAEGRLETVSYLLAKGAAPHVSDRWNAKPIDDAKRHGHADIETLLIEETPKKSAAA